SSIAGSQQQGGKKTINGPPPQPTLPAVRHAILELFARLPPQRCPHCRKWICNERRPEEICQSNASQGERRRCLWRGRCLAAGVRRGPRRRGCGLRGLRLPIHTPTFATRGQEFHLSSAWPPFGGSAHECRSFCRMGLLIWRLCFVWERCLRRGSRGRNLSLELRPLRRRHFSEVGPGLPPCMVPA